MAQNKLTKADIVEHIYPEVAVSKKNIQKILDLFLEQVKSGLLSDKVVELRGFGTFEVKTRKARKGRIHKTGERVEVEDHGVAAFRPGRELKEKAWDIGQP